MSVFYLTLRISYQDKNYNSFLTREPDLSSYFENDETNNFLHEDSFFVKIVKYMGNFTYFYAFT